jgi:two-component system chemotaxis response regulator CheB
MAKKIRVMIVDDSVFFREFMSRSLSQDQEIEVVGVAGDAFEAMEKLSVIKPDVITLDMEMPKMRGPEFLKQVRPRFPQIQVVVISALSSNVFEALAAGAVDFVSKPNTRPGFDNAAFIAETLNKIRIAMASTASRTMVAATAPPPPRSTRPAAAPPPLIPIGGFNFPNKRSVVAIGASTGGTEAILAVVRDLPANTPGIVVVQHMPPVFTRMYAERLDKICKMSVREAQNGDRVDPGTILIAAGDRHMRLRSDTKGYFVQCQEGEKVSGHCPSVDALFESVASAAGNSAVGVILTGMGADGAKNLLNMRKRGAHTIGQDQATSVVYGMPMVAFNLGGVAEQLPLQQIPEAILRRLVRG